ncbi:hypothetical protein CBER1_11147 [Cercospora berteroae]|uniref:Uncharacterized protein n=1 Tax=Cercospora berteroae TaxID=357750 RepID=A0A2S6BYS1_9PEZI|nr:hypothetical protein CBER1_11147 [Cercospora berteroae]
MPPKKMQSLFAAKSKPGESRKRLTLTNKLDRMFDLPNTNKVEILDKLEGAAKAFRGKRYHAPRTKSRQDHHRRMYIAYLAWKRNEDPDCRSDEKWDECKLSKPSPSAYPPNTSHMSWHLVQKRDESLARAMFRDIASWPFASVFTAHGLPPGLESPSSIPQTLDRAPLLTALTKLVLFPEDFEVLWQSVREFMIWVYHLASPRSLATGERIQYRSLCHYRDSIMYLAFRSYRMRRIAAPPLQTAHFEMTEAMRGVVDEYGDPNAKRVPKTYLGLVELRQLIDQEMQTNRSIENSEQHQAVWCIVRHTSARPGSIGTSGKYARNLPLQWRNVEFYRGDNPGEFTCVLEFDDIRIKRPSDPERAARHQEDETPLKVVMKSPQPDNIIFSVPHRLLVIALRRKALQGIDTIAELLEGTQQRILVKDEFKDQALFYRSQPKGTGIDTKQPLSANAMTDYLKNRARTLGYTGAVTMYSLRRMIATELVARIGFERTRVLMGHSPDSTTLERYYFAMGDIFDSTSAALQQPLAEGGISEKIVKEWAPLALGRLDDIQRNNTRGLALRAMTNRLINDDQGPPENLDRPEVRKQYRARMRACAQKALMEEQANIAKKTLTQAEFRARRGAMNASHFAEAVLARAQAIASSHTGTPDTPDAVAETDALEVLETDVVEGDLDALAQKYVDEQQDSNDSPLGHVEMGIDQELDPEPQDEETAVPYKGVAEVFMGVLMDNSANLTEVWSEKWKRCPECFLDPTVSYEKKAQEYPNKTKLEQHLTESTFHTPLDRIRREQKNRQADHPKGKWQCKYCQHADDMPEEDKKLCSSHSQLTTHIKDSNAENTSAEHDRLKAEDGWYDPDWTRLNPATQVKKAQAGMKNLKTLGFSTAEQKRGNGEDFAAFPGLVRGTTAAPLARFGDAFSAGSSAGPVAASKRFGDQLVGGEHIKSGLTSVPRELRAGLKSGVSQPEVAGPGAPLSRKPSKSAPSASRHGPASRTRPMPISSGSSSLVDDDDVFTDRGPRDDDNPEGGKGGREPFRLTRHGQ